MQKPFCNIVHEAGHYIAGRRYIGDCVAAYFSPSEICPLPFTEFAPNKIITPMSSVHALNIWYIASADGDNYKARASQLEKPTVLSGDDAKTAVKILLFLRFGDLVLQANDISSYECRREKDGYKAGDVTKINRILLQYGNVKQKYERNVGVFMGLMSNHRLIDAARTYESSQDKVQFLRILDEISDGLPDVAADAL